jgi:hypothetical protein
MYRRYSNNDADPMRNSFLLNKDCLNAILLSSALAVLAFTGCSSASGTAENRNLTGNRVGAYHEQNQENFQPADSASNPGYEWFY